MILWNRFLQADHKHHYLLLILSPAHCRLRVQLNQIVFADAIVMQLQSNWFLATRCIALRKASTAALAAAKILEKKPDHPDANLATGKFALERGQFETAFAMLAKSKDAVLLDIASES